MVRPQQVETQPALRFTADVMFTRLVQRLLVVVLPGKTTACHLRRRAIVIVQVLWISVFSLVLPMVWCFSRAQEPRTPWKNVAQGTIPSMSELSWSCHAGSLNHIFATDLHSRFDETPWPMALRRTGGQPCVRRSDAWAIQAIASGAYDAASWQPALALGGLNDRAYLPWPGRPTSPRQTRQWRVEQEHKLVIKAGEHSLRHNPCW